MDWKIKNLVKSLNTYCKTKGDLSCADIIPLLNDHLKKRALCRYVRQDLLVILCLLHSCQCLLEFFYVTVQ